MRGQRTSSKTFFSPRWVKAEHSVYLTAPTSLANRSPCSCVMGRCFCRPSFSMLVGSSLRRQQECNAANGARGVGMGKREKVTRLRSLWVPTTIRLPVSICFEVMISVN